MALQKQLQSFFGQEENNKNENMLTESIHLSLSVQFDSKKWLLIKNSKHKKINIKLQPCKNISFEQSLCNFIIIRITQFHSNIIMTADLKIQKFKFNRIQAVYQINSLLFQKGFSNYYFYSINDDLNIRYQQIFWQFQDIQNVEWQIQYIEDELHKLLNNLNFQSLIEYLFEEEQKIIKPQTWLNNLISKANFQFPLMKTLSVMDVKQKSFKPFQLINVLAEKLELIQYQSHNLNNLYQKQYVKKITFELNQKQITSLYQLQQKIQGYFILLPEQKQKMLQNAFINFGYDFGKKSFYQFDQDEIDLNTMITSQELQNLGLKQLKKLVESVSIIYHLQEHLILNDEYFNESVFQVNNKGRLKINLLNSNELNISKNNEQKNNTQKIKPNRIQQIFKLMVFIIEIKQFKQLSEEEGENLFKLKQIVQYNQQTGLLQIPQILYVLDHIQFSSKQKKNNNE
ncbi:unnamed protein product [Paramecium pentaurelia]|uniref:Uncharacterized protein n=1 Tax=Paramecium pentaurelia TaxID=43138 RepID=A0A8S1T466_9CILI|nr:unnamed protein product [Paramecium pentaurelia]